MEFAVENRLAVNVKLKGKFRFGDTYSSVFLSARASHTHVNFLGLVLDQIFIHISSTEQAALFTLRSTILPKENVPPPSVPPPAARDTFPQAGK